jgi:hypothetical protein
MSAAQTGRPLPSFAPFVRAAKKPAGPCRECGAQGPHLRELLHLQRIFSEDAPGRPATMASMYPLCGHCVARTEAAGWHALPRTWLALTGAPAELVAMLEVQTEGGVH